jgi:hypothetical protein
MSFLFCRNTTTYEARVAAFIVNEYIEQKFSRDAMLKIGVPVKRF